MEDQGRILVFFGEVPGAPQTGQPSQPPRNCRALRGKTVSTPQKDHGVFGAQGVIRETTRGVTGTRSGRVAR